MRSLALAALAVVACQTGTPAPGAERGSGQPAGKAGPSVPLVATLTRAEAESLCNAFERSGAADDTEANRGYLIANWMAKEIVSDTGRAWLVNFAQLGQDKAARRDALARVARDAGLAGCPLTSMWE
ncbi:MAG: hypothetical protein IPL61_20770 [Myxococcales bacterium]|nr:hypothetical protein [Myxococcales bacterium]